MNYLSGVAESPSLLVCLLNPNHFPCQLLLDGPLYSPPTSSYIVRKLRL